MNEQVKFVYIYIYMKEPIIMIEIITVEYASQELHSLCALTLKSALQIPQNLF